MRNAVTAAVQPSSRPRKRLQKDHIRLYLLFLPVAAWYIIFQYVPMGGLVIAFQDFKILKGIGASKFVGFDNFVYLFSLPSFLQAIRNTLIMAVQRLVFSFPRTDRSAARLHRGRPRPERSERHLWSEHLRHAQHLQHELPVHHLWCVRRGPGQQYLLNDDGTVTTNVISDEYKAAVSYLHDIYAAGYMDPEIFTNSNSQAYEKFATGKMGFWPCWWSNPGSVYVKYGFLDNCPTGKITLVDPIVGPDGKSGLIGTDPIWRVLGITSRLQERG